jgi:hypothetical protein
MSGFNPNLPMFSMISPRVITALMLFKNLENMGHL